MTTRTKKIALTGACLVVLVAAAVSIRGGDHTADNDELGGPPAAWSKPAEDKQPATGRWVKVAEAQVSGPKTRAEAIESEGLPPAQFIKREAPAALATAEKFLAGYFASEVGEGGKAAKRRIFETAAPQLAAYLLSRRPRQPGASEMPPRAQVDAVAIEFDKPPTTAWVRAEIRRADDRSDIAVIVEQVGRGQWLVTQITE